MNDNHLITICADLHIVIVNVSWIFTFCIIRTSLRPDSHQNTPSQQSSKTAPQSGLVSWTHASSCCTHWSMRQVAENSQTLGADIRKGFIVGDNSAGGNIASVIALKARDDISKVPEK